MRKLQTQRYFFLLFYLCADPFQHIMKFLAQDNRKNKNVKKKIGIDTSNNVNELYAFVEWKKRFAASSVYWRALVTPLWS